MKKYLAILVFAALVGGSVVRAQEKMTHDGEKMHVVVRPDDIKWGPMPPGLPSNAQAAVLAGDPAKSEPFVIRAKLPDGYRVPAHWHAIDENITVIKGTFLVGSGDKLDASKMEEMPSGAFCSMPARMHHFAMAKGETIIQVHGVGPFDITYINPADDPRKTAGTK